MAALIKIDGHEYVYDIQCNIEAELVNGKFVYWHFDDNDPATKDLDEVWTKYGSLWDDNM
jgi:hypothetical protein